MNNISIICFAYAVAMGIHTVFIHFFKIWLYFFDIIYIFTQNDCSH